MEENFTDFKKIDLKVFTEIKEANESVEASLGDFDTFLK